MIWEDELCIVSGDNRAWQDGQNSNTVIELWCRSKFGHSVLLLVNGLRPYIEISDPKTDEINDSPSLTLSSVSANKDVQGEPEYIGMKLSQDGTIRPHYKVFLKNTTKVRSVRKILSDQGWIVTSADILFVQRLLLDRDLGPHIKVKGKILWSTKKSPKKSRNSETTDSELALKRIQELGGSGIYPTDLIISCKAQDIFRTEPFPAPFVTFSFDLETSIANNTILCAAAVIDRAGIRSEFPIKGAETHILERLTEIVREEDPDFITGYNIDNFDLPRMQDRSEYIEPKSEIDRSELFGWGRVPVNENETKRGYRRLGRIFPNREQNRVWTIKGRIPLDAWWQARQTLRPQRESLRYVSQLLWPDDEEMHKLDIDASNMDQEWKERPDEVLNYCVRDTILPLDILEKMKSIARKEALASVSLTTVDVASTSTTSRWNDSLVIRLADRKGVAVPNTQGFGKQDQIAGGYVHEVESGVEPWIVVLDFKSMYPSIMITNNICSTTLVRDDSEEDSHHVSPNTKTRYLSKDERLGLVPQLLKVLMDSRDTHKKALAKANKEGDEAEAFLQDQLQYAVKILMNSFYGVFASSFYRFTHPLLGASITEWARHNIRTIISGLEEEGSRVVYSDTDSIFVRAPVESGAPIHLPENKKDKEKWEKSKDITLKFGNSLAERFSKEGAELEFETALSSFFSHGAKKRYVGRVVWPREEMLVRGYEVRRTDSFQLQSTTMTKMFELILDGKTEEAINMTKSVIDRIREGDIDPSKLVISRSCKGRWDPKKNDWDFSMYSNPDGLPYVRAAKQRISAGLQFTPGMKVGYIITEPREEDKGKLGVQAWLVDEIGGDPPSYDPNYYAKRLAKSFGRITEAFGEEHSEKELLKGPRPKGQSSIFDF